MDLVATAFENSFYSLLRVFFGVAMAFVIGVPLGILRSLLPISLKRNIIFNFLIDAGKYPPPIAWIPFVILFIGIGNTAAAMIVLIGAFSPIFTNTYEGVEKIPQILVLTTKTFKVSFFKKLKILFMTSLPQTLTGLKIAIGMGWMSVIAAEMISGQNGLGYSIQMNRFNMQYDAMSVDMLFIAIVGFLLHWLTGCFETRLLYWHESRS